MIGLETSFTKKLLHARERDIKRMAAIPRAANDPSQAELRQNQIGSLLKNSISSRAEESCSNSTRGSYHITRDRARTQEHGNFEPSRAQETRLELEKFL
jgi:hypothetical protein